MLKHKLSSRRPQWISLWLLLALLVGVGLRPSGVAQAATVYGPVVVRPGGAQLYDAPEGESMATLPTSTVFTARGRTADALWVMGATVVADEDDDGVPEGTPQQGWLRVEQVIAVGVELLPVVDGEDANLIAANADAADADAAEVAESTDAASDEAAMDAPLMGTVASGDDRLNVRRGPGTAYTIVAKALPGESYAVVGRNADGTWLQIDRDGEPGWVAAAYMEMAGDVMALPVVDAAALPATSPPEAATIPPVAQTAAPEGAAVAAFSGTGLQGTLVIESSPGGMMYGYALESGALWALTNGFDPAISPDGQTVAFVRDGGEHGLYLVDIDGSNERLIFSGRARISSPKWSPDGAWILFTRGDEEYHCIDLGGNCISPPSSPDGREITIPGAETTTRYWYKLARVDRDGNDYRDIASLTSARAADWNTAGIVYESNAGLQITADVPDAENVLVIFDYLKPYFSDPDWQPEGGRIVYMGKEASHWELFAVNPDGSGAVALTRPATTVVDEIPSNVAPVWSPDGQHIAFLSNRDAGGEAGAWRVWVMDADGGNQRALPIDVAINYTFGGEQSISWGS